MTVRKSDTEMRRGMNIFRPAAAMLLVSLLSSCTTDDLFSPRPSVDVGTMTAALAPVRPLPPTPVHSPAPAFSQPATTSLPAAPAIAPSSAIPQPVPMTVGYIPRLSVPGMGGSGTEQAMPVRELQCRKELARLGATFRDLPPINDGGGCGIAYPVEYAGAGGGIEIAPAATLTCDMALAFTRWTRSELAPSARLRYLAGIRTIHQGSSYSCRTIDNIRGGRLSQHASGNALDVMAITLKNGRYVDVHKPGLFSFRERGFLNNVRADACDYFTTVLGPGYNAAHRNHFHFDIMDRRSGYRACR